LLGAQEDDIESQFTDRAVEVAVNVDGISQGGESRHVLLQSDSVVVPVTVVVEGASSAEDAADAAADALGAGQNEAVDTSVIDSLPSGLRVVEARVSYSAKEGACGPATPGIMHLLVALLLGVACMARME
jgi:hypothetical protein